MNEIFRTAQKRTESNMYRAINLKKAHDSLDRGKFFQFLKNRAQKPGEKHLVSLIREIYSNQVIKISNLTVKVEKGVM
jgi:hypothetical protein